MKKLSRFGILAFALLTSNGIVFAGVIDSAATTSPEIPTGFAPFLLVGALGLTFYMKKFFDKK